MCLIVHAPAGKTVEDEWLRDFYTRNADGYGIMYHKDGKLHIFKRLASVEHFIEDWKKFVEYERVVHLRMRTHGDIDMTNCHPYVVQASPWGIALMHNGVLSSGNDSDKTKSDTWHYIENYLKPILAKQPDLLHVPAFQAMVEHHIGSNNRFVFMDHTGAVIILNKEAGVEWNDLWLSNRYAWNSNKALPTTPPYQNGYHGYGGYQGYQGGYQPSAQVYQHPAAASRSDWQKPSESDKSESAGVSDSKQNSLPLPVPSIDPEGEDLRKEFAAAYRMLQYNGYARCASIGPRSMYLFKRKYGDEILYDMIDALLDGEIDEDDYLDLIYGIRYPNQIKSAIRTQRRHAGFC